MTHDNTSVITREAAHRFVHSLGKPESIGKRQWKGVFEFLKVIAAFYPRAYPSEARIAKRMDVGVRTVQRYVALAVDAGLLVVEADAGAVPKRRWGSKTNRYWLKSCQSHAANVAPYTITDTYGVCSGTPSQETSSPGPSPARPASRLASQILSPSQPEGSTVIQMSEWERSRQVGAPPDPPSRLKIPPRRWPAAGEIVKPIDSRRRKAKRPPKPPPEWRRLAEYFAVLWEQAILEAPHLKGIRGLESYGQAKTYIEAHFASRTELEVRKMMEEFAAAAMQGIVTIKPRQSAWMCFTGAWGRQQHVEVGDPYAAYRKES